MKPTETAGASRSVRVGSEESPRLAPAAIEIRRGGADFVIVLERRQNPLCEERLAQSGFATGYATKQNGKMVMDEGHLRDRKRLGKDRRH